MQNGYTPLHCAAYVGHVELVQLLLRHGANKELKNHRGEKPGDRVCHPGDVKATKGNKKHEAAIKKLLR